MVTDQDCISLILALYEYKGIPPVVWDHLDTGADDDGVYWAVKRWTDGTYIVVLRGSVTLGDFERDADTLVVYDPLLGPVHAGFVRGMHKVWSELKPIIGTAHWVVTGHSLGAAETDDLAGIGVQSYNPPLRYVRFGEPRPGFQRLADILAHVPGVSYINQDASGHDTITDWPEPILPKFPFTRPQELSPVSASPAPNDHWGPFRYHHAQLYAKALGLSV
jgi:hypothetical protein